MEYRVETLRLLQSGMPGMLRFWRDSGFSVGYGVNSASVSSIKMSPFISLKYFVPTKTAGWNQAKVCVMFGLSQVITL